MRIRVALYDIRVLSTGVIDHKESPLKLHQAITLPGTYAIGLQKIAVRAAICWLFPLTAWHVVRKTQSGSVSHVHRPRFITRCGRDARRAMIAASSR
jgi:hypothetical protein